MKMAFPIVKLSQSFPSIAVLFFINYNPKASVSKLIQHTWFGRLNLAPELQDFHEAWARYFWTVVVRRTNSNKTTYRNGKHKVSTFSNLTYEDTRNDAYLWLRSDNTSSLDRINKIGDLVALFNAVRKASNLPDSTEDALPAMFNRFLPYMQAVAPANPAYDSSGDRAFTVREQEYLTNEDF